MGWTPTTLTEPNILNGDPIPALDHVPTPWGVPPGCEADFHLLRRNDGVSGPYYLQRPIIKPRLGVLHTNAASVQSNVAGQVGYGNAGTNNTKPTYVQDDLRMVKLMPSNRRAIANSTASDVEAAHGEIDCSFWSLAIETVDMGTIKAGAEGYPAGDLGPFLNNNMLEQNARVFAYESIANGMGRPNPPQTWNGAGWVTHTWPFPPRHYTIHFGKTCPGGSKVWQYFNIILPRAQILYDAWTGIVETPPVETPVEDDMKLEAITPVRIDSRNSPWQAKLVANEVREVWIADPIDAIPDDARFAIINVTAVPGSLTKGWLGVLYKGKYVGTVNFNKSAAANQMLVPLDANGHIHILSNKSIDWVLDVSGYAA